MLPGQPHNQHYHVLSERWTAASTVGWAHLRVTRHRCHRRTVPSVTTHRDLDVLGMLALEAPKQHAEESARHEVQEG
jgi:hypothetical protein